jgi:hypothetical protein
LNDVADIADRAAIESMMEGVAAVVHLAGVGGDYTLEDLWRVSPFPLPAHQTGRADFPHPAFRLAS